MPSYAVNRSVKPNSSPDIKCVNIGVRSRTVAPSIDNRMCIRIPRGKRSTSTPIIKSTFDTNANETNNEMPPIEFSNTTFPIPPSNYIRPINPSTITSPIDHFTTTTPLNGTSTTMLPIDPSSIAPPINLANSIHPISTSSYTSHIATSTAILQNEKQSKSTPLVHSTTTHIDHSNNTLPINHSINIPTIDPSINTATIEPSINTPTIEPSINKLPIDPLITTCPIDTTTGKLCIELYTTSSCTIDPSKTIPLSEPSTTKPPIETYIDTAPPMEPYSYTAPSIEILKQVCDLCGRRFLNKSSLRIHRDTHHTHSYLTCDQCNLTFVTQKGLDNHALIHINPAECPLYACYFCETCFSLDCNLLTHLRQKHGMKRKFTDATLDLNNYAESMHALNNYECTECCSMYLDKKHLDYHMHTEHMSRRLTSPEMERIAIESDGVFVCRICKLSFDRQCVYECHSRLHNRQTVTDAPPIATCEICAKHFNSDSKLKVHISRHHDAHFPCNTCDKTFTNKLSLNTHLRYMHPTGGISCKKCKQIFPTRDCCKEHELTVHESKYQCSYCNQILKTMSSLKRHYLVHSDQKPFLCQVCNKTFRSKSTLDSHEGTHLVVKPFNCSLCRVGFVTASAHRKHMKRHRDHSPTSICNSSDDSCPPTSAEQSASDLRLDSAIREQIHIVKTIQSDQNFSPLFEVESML